MKKGLVQSALMAAEKVVVYGFLVYQETLDSKRTQPKSREEGVVSRLGQ